jgi:hypothetical protein
LTVNTVQYVSGKGFTYPGVYCAYSPDAGACTTSLVTYTSGAGFKAYVSQTAANYSCTTGTFVGYDTSGAGFTTTTISTASKCLATSGPAVGLSTRGCAR